MFSQKTNRSPWYPIHGKWWTRRAAPQGGFEARPSFGLHEDNQKYGEMNARRLGYFHVVNKILQMEWICGFHWLMKNLSTLFEIFTTAHSPTQTPGSETKGTKWTYAMYKASQESHCLASLSQVWESLGNARCIISLWRKKRAWKVRGS